MAVAAETLRFCGNSSVLDNALLHWFATQGEQFVQALQYIQHLPERVLYLSSKDRPRIPQFNVYRLQVRWQELLEKSEFPEIARQKLLELARIDLRTYIEEYVLRKNTLHFTLKTHSAHGNHIITDEYSTPLLTMAHEAVRDFMKQGLPTSRMKADYQAIARMMEWAEHGKDGDCAINISPAGNSYLGKNMYSFMFVRRLHILPNGNREIRTTQHKVWLSHINILRLLVQIHAPIPAHTQATELSLTRLFLQLPQDFSEESMLQIAHQLPQQQIPKEYEEVSLKHSEAFQKEYDAVEQFFLTLVDKTFQQLSHTPQKNQLTLWKKLEEAINFGQRRLLKVVSDDEKNAIEAVSAQHLTHLFETYSAHVYDGKKLNSKAAIAVTSELTGILGSLGKVTSMGQCLGGSLFSLNLGGTIDAATQYRGIPLNILAQESGGKFHFENCPFCATRMKVIDMPNGDIVCSGCGNAKICGAEHNHTTTTDNPTTASHQSSKEIRGTNHQQPMRNNTRGEENPISLGDFVAGLLL